MGEAERSARAHGIFSAVLDERADRREALLERLCAGDAEMRGWVESLLQAALSDHPLLDAALPDLAARVLDEPDPAGQRIGAYRIVREIGRGGMGVVFLAERDDGEFQQQVALKVIRGGPDADRLADRFRRERQILATLQHPNIAQLHDGGRSPEGYPFLAMEYVEGERIDRYCEQLGLGIEERVRLFTTVCAAVDHAHRNLVVHRDLKPAHVLVTLDGTVKLLDFGIAKLLPGAAVDDDETQTGAHAFTPRYSSPEQIRRGPITTASDVYALGLILFELLAGRPPFTGDDDPFEAARARLEEEPPPPSAVAQRWSRRSIRGDLDAIVLRALETDPDRRYATATLLRDDLERWLRHDPVVARPDRAGYRLRKFIRRHRLATGAALLATVLSTGFGAFHFARVTAERNRAELEARKASEVRDFLLGLFTSSTPDRTLGDTLRLRDLLERGVLRADSLADQPELRALLLATLGDVYRVLGRYDVAQPLLEQALDGFRAIPQAPPLDLAGALTSMALLHYDLRQFEAALPLTREALAIQRRELGEDHPDPLSSLANLATLAANTGQYDEAFTLHSEVLERRRRLLGTDHPGVAFTLNNIGTLLVGRERLAEAEDYFLEALAQRRRLLSPEHPDLALSMSNLASLYSRQDRWDEAEALHRETLELRLQVLGDQHPRVAVSHYNLGQLLRKTGRFEEAEVHLRAALAIDRQVYAPDHPEIGTDAFMLGTLLAEKGECDAAEPLLAEAVAIFERSGRGTERIVLAREALEDCRGG
jgi:eukaryotic-like serine/threonine-protein kinase